MADLAALQVKGGQEKNSLEKDPKFVSTTSAVIDVIIEVGIIKGVQ